MKKVELFKHNKTTYDNITKIFETSNKCATVQPTGSGKSFLIFKLAQDNSDKTVVVFEPNKQIIGRVSEQMKEYGIENIKFFTYQKLNSQHKRGEISIENADYICLDELHRIKAKQWEQAVIAIQDKFPNAKVLGLTATPERMDGQNIVDYFGAELACNITLGDAIVNKILPCPTYISALYTFDEEIQRVNNKINESRNSDEEKEEMRDELKVARKQLENALGVPTILEKHIPDSKGKYIVFCQNVEHLTAMKPVIEDWFAQAGFETHTYEVYRKNPNHKSEYIGFKSDNSDCIKLCLCVDMFNEGVHLEVISGVILLRPTQSNIIYFQQIGRAISASDKNIPIIFDLVNNGNCLGGGSLRTEIETAADRQRIEISNVDGECENDVFDIGDFHIYDYVKDSLDVLNVIENKCVDEFDFRLKQLEEYKAKWGHCCVMKEEAKEWDGLFIWAANQRSNKIKESISQNRIDILNQYGFIWDLERWKFNKVIVKIKKYVEDGNSLPIPYKYICKDGFKLGQQITIFKTSKKDGTLRKDFENELISLGIELKFKNFDEQWMENYSIAKKYIDETNKTIVARTKYKGFNIGTWLNKNIQLYRKGKLSTEKIKLLDGLCDLSSRLLDLSDKNDKIWNKNFIVFQEYLSLHGSIDRAIEYKGIRIGAWYGSQCTLYRNGRLRKDRLQKIKSLGSDLLEPKLDKPWNLFLTTLDDCIKNDVPLNSNTVYNGVEVNKKIIYYRLRYHKGKLSEEKYYQLLKRGIDLNETCDKERYDNWNNFVALLKECIKNGIKLTGSTVYKDIKMGIKLKNCRQRYKQGDFPEEHYRQLLELGIDLAKEGSLM